MGVFTSTVPTFAAGERVKASKLTTLRNFANAATSAMTTYSPTLTNITLGSGPVTTARYRQLGKDVFFRVKVVLGSGGAFGTGPSFTLPVAPHSSYAMDIDIIGAGFLFDASVKAYDCSVRFKTGSTCEIVYLGTSSQHTQVTATAPWTAGQSDGFSVVGRYEAA